MRRDQIRCQREDVRGCKSVVGHHMRDARRAEGYLLYLPLTHSLTHSLTYQLVPTYLLTYLPTHLLTYSLTYLLTYSRTYLLTYHARDARCAEGLWPRDCIWLLALRLCDRCEHPVPVVVQLGRAHVQKARVPPGLHKHAHMCTCMHVHACMRACARVHAHVCTYACAPTCTSARRRPR